MRSYRLAPPGPSRTVRLRETSINNSSGGPFALRVLAPQFRAEQSEGQQHGDGQPQADQRPPHARRQVPDPRRVGPQHQPDQRRPAEQHPRQGPGGVDREGHRPQVSRPPPRGSVGRPRPVLPTGTGRRRGALFGSRRTGWRPAVRRRTPPPGRQQVGEHLLPQPAADRREVQFLRGPTEGVAVLAEAGVQFLGGDGGEVAFRLRQVHAERPQQPPAGGVRLVPPRQFGEGVVAGTRPRRRPPPRPPRRGRSGGSATGPAAAAPRPRPPRRWHVPETGATSVSAARKLYRRSLRGR